MFKIPKTYIIMIGNVILACKILMPPPRLWKLNTKYRLQQVGTILKIPLIAK